MGTSRNPAKAAAEKKLSSPSDFKKKRSPIVELPSGMTVRLINPGGLKVLVAQGMIPNSLMPSVQASLNTGQPMEAPAPSEVSPELIAEMMDMMNNITLQCFAEPKLLPIPEEGVERDEDQLYVDEVEDEDKMFIFQWLTSGNADVERFRQEQKRNVATLAGQPAMGSEA